MGRLKPDTARRDMRRAAHLFTLGFLILWAIYAQIVEPFIMPGPVSVAVRLYEFFTDYHLVKHMFWSFAHIGGAILASFLIGSACAFLVFYLPSFRIMVHGRLSPFLNSFSGIGWTLLAIIWFGVNDFTVMFAISMVLIPFSIINMREGLEAIDREMLEMGASFGRGRWRAFRLLILPALFPFVFATLRISFGVAWKVALTAELFGGDTGLGYLLNLARQDFDMPMILVVIIVIIMFVYSTDRWVFAPVQTRLARHHAALG
ncbi:MAG: ABC transporter permease subunit [Defluviicoccus sp.]|nr:ABC transporter permease subunit [Defluviicoccus sp.]MDE0384942.1 ABC transporter permease subunit [Defluviicoccus sp.]